jgi:hypothetical protein
MAAIDAFNSIIEQLSPADRQSLTETIAHIRLQLEAARSEDARMRLIEVFTREAREQLHTAK